VITTNFIVPSKLGCYPFQRIVEIRRMIHPTILFVFLRKFRFVRQQRLIRREGWTKRHRIRGRRPMVCRMKIRPFG